MTKANPNKYYQGCLLANSEHNCYYFMCEKRGNCEQFKEFQRRSKNDKSQNE